MNVWAITYEFGGEYKTLLKEFTEGLDSQDVRSSLHPVIASKNPAIEFVGTLA